MTLWEVATALGLDPRAVERLAESGDLPGRRTDAGWRFRASELTNWSAAHLQRLPAGQDRSRSQAGSDLLISLALQPITVAVPLTARTRSSVLSELVTLADRSGQIVDARGLLDSLMDREKQRSTALEGRVAIPHSTQIGQHVIEWPVIAAGRSQAGIPFGDPSGKMTDLFFLLCCQDYRQHLLYLGRLCRLLSEAKLLASLRETEKPADFVAVLLRQERELCESP